MSKEQRSPLPTNHNSIPDQNRLVGMAREDFLVQLQDTPSALTYRLHTTILGVSGNVPGPLWEYFHAGQAVIHTSPNVIEHIGSYLNLQDATQLALTTPNALRTSGHLMMVLSRRSPEEQLSTAQPVASSSNAEPARSPQWLQTEQHRKHRERTQSR